MPPKRPRCIQCKETNPVDACIKSNFGYFCSTVCQREYSQRNYKRVLGKVKATKEKAIKTRHVKRKKELRTRTQWYDLLQVEVNKLVRIRDINEPCCTCGTTNPNIKYDAGHCFTRAARPDIRFELTNIHKQCSVKCNQHGSGMRHEYQLFISGKYGAGELKWLKDESEHDSLKKQFPHWTDIEKEIKRYRKLNNRG